MEIVVNPGSEWMRNLMEILWEDTWSFDVTLHFRDTLLKIFSNRISKEDSAVIRQEKYRSEKGFETRIESLATTSKR